MVGLSVCSPEPSTSPRIRDPLDLVFTVVWHSSNTSSFTHGELQRSF